MDEERVTTLVSLLRDKGESEIKQTFEVLGVPDEEREEIRRRLSELRPPPEGLTPEELLDNEHFQQLVALTRRGKAILFVGAGVSVDVGMPSSGRLLGTLREEARVFGREIPLDAPFPRAAQIVEDIVGRADMVGVLRREFESAMKADPPPYRRGAYRLLPAIPQLNRLVVTTNWDDLLRRAFQDAGKRATEILEEAQTRQVVMSEHSVIKLHGSFQNPAEMVVTDTDYAFATRQIARRTAGTLWGYLTSLLAQYSFIFLGYRLGDLDFRLLRRMVESEMDTWQKSAPHFLVAPLTQAESSAASQWADVRPIPATATNFLLALFRQLDEFANRLDELDAIFKRQSPPLIEFHGHFGSGKSELLDRAEQRAQAEGWLPRQIVRVNWDRRRDGTPRRLVRSRTEIIQVLNEDLEPSVTLKRFEDLAGYLRDKRGVFLIFDATQCVQNQRELVSLLSEIVAPAIQEMNEQGQRSKLLVGGRYPLRGWPYHFRRSLLSHALTPFDAPVVREMAQKLLLATDPDSQERFEPELITDILEVSSGHAGFIKAVLMDLMSEERWHNGRTRLPRRLVEEEKREYVSRFNADIDEHVPWQDEPLKEVYDETLCVLRWLNREMVRELNLSFDPFPGLTAVYVLSPDNFSNDQVIRRTKMFRLRYEQPEKLVEAHRRAQEIFVSGIERLLHPLQLDYILEWLFHTAHLLLVEEPQDPEARFGKLVRLVEECVHYRSHPEQVRGEVGAQLVRRITDEDRELWNLLEKCVGKEGIEEILAILERKEVLDVG